MPWRSWEYNVNKKIGCGIGHGTAAKRMEGRKMDEKTKQIAEGLQCKYTVFEAGADSQQVEKAYLEAYEAGKTRGFWPAVVCLDEYAVEWFGIAQQEYDRDSILTGSAQSGKKILDERYEENTEYYKEGGMEEFIGEETQGEELQHFCGYVSFSGPTLQADTLLLEVPVKNPWEIIAYLPMGGWNECPAPEDMAAICKYWYEKYKAVPAAFTHDVMEFYAPLGLNGVDSLEAAKEHYAFCLDRIDQGTRTGTLSELAAGLEHSKVWYFWWD